MAQEPSANATAFVAAGALALAYFAAPLSGASDVEMVYRGLFASLAALAGVLLAIQALRGAEARPSPWPGAVGWLTWQLRPRGWMIAWAAVLAVVGLWGTPHLAYEYPPRTPHGVCTYVGLKGALRVSHTSARCPWLVWL